MTDPLRVDSRRSSGADSDPTSTRLPPTGTAASSAPPTPRERAAAAAASYERAIDQAPSGTGGSLRIFLANNAPLTEEQRTTRVQAELDAFRDRASGPYFAEGQVVSVPPHFAIVGGANHCDGAALMAIAAGVRPVSLARAVAAVQSGRGTPDQVVKLTQALIDAGKLPPASAKQEPLVGRIHQMQWRYGIGFDCAGYSQQAVAAAVGKPREAIFPNALDGAISFARMQKVPLGSARAGDMFVLDPPKGEDVGHKTVVYSHVRESVDQARSDMAAAGIPMPVIFALGGGGPIDIFQVDSSWGAGLDGRLDGGYRRETWLHNETTGLWARRTPLTTDWTLSDKPYSHPINGVYRPPS